MPELDASTAADSTPLATADGSAAVEVEQPVGEQRPDVASAGADSPDPAPGASPTSDFPAPLAMSVKDAFDWDEGVSPVDNYANLGLRLAACGSNDLVRTSAYTGGLLLGSPNPLVPATLIKDARQLAAVITDRVRVKVTSNGKDKGGVIPSKHLQNMLASEAFLQQFRPVDRVEQHSRYGPDFVLTRPGYNDGGPGQRVLHRGEEPRIDRSLVAIKAFLKVMTFEGEADRTNAVAAALTVMLRNFWPGAKPAIVVTSTKSHGGKETVILFAAGATPHVSISYQATDWALERSLVGALKHTPDVGVVNVENARLNRDARVIASAFLERFITDPEPLLFSTGTGEPIRRRNDIVVAISTNFGTVSEDLMNRACQSTSTQSATWPSGNPP